MFRPYHLHEGTYLVKLARKTVEAYLTSGTVKPPEGPPQKFLVDNYGVFTTIEALRGEKYELRGCVGYPEGYKNTLYATMYSALGACCNDPRFPALGPSELAEVVFEVSILSPMTPLAEDRRRHLESIQIGRHGLLIRRGPYSGLLLPQVAVDECWDAESFLAHTCMKAWLPGDCWLDRKTKVYIYQAQIFREETPLGDVYERDLQREVRCSRETRKET